MGLYQQLGGEPLPQRGDKQRTDEAQAAQPGAAFAGFLYRIRDVGVGELQGFQLFGRYALVRQPAGKQVVAENTGEGQCRELARRLGLPRTAGRPELAAVVAARTGREPAAVLSLLTDPVDSDAGLVTLTRELDSLRQEALHV